MRGMTDQPPPARGSKTGVRRLADGDEIPNQPPDDQHLSEIIAMRAARLIEEGKA